MRNLAWLHGEFHHLRCREDPDIWSERLRLSLVEADRSRRPISARSREATTSETQQRVFYEGLITGLIGYITVAAVLAIVDLAMGHPLFYTVATLGNAVFGGTGGGEAAVTPGAVFTYNGVHVLAFVIFGILVAWLVVETELHPAIWYVAFMVLLAAFFLATVLAAGAGTALGESLSWWSVVLANVLAALAMGMYLHRAHPRLLRRVSKHGDPELEEPEP